MTDPVAVSGTRRRIKELVDGTLRVEIDIDPGQKKNFLDLFPEIDSGVALAPLKVGETSETVGQKREPGADRHEPSYAEKLHRNRYWHNPKLWRAMDAARIYTQEQHKTWVQSQKCCGKKFIRDHACQGDVVAHHTPGAELPAAGKGSDNPRKPPHWYTVPACHWFHTWVHNSNGASREEKRELVELGVGMAAERVKEAMKQYLKVTSTTELTPEVVQKFEEEIGLR